LAPPMILEPPFLDSLELVYLMFALSGFILGWVAQRGNYCFVNAMTSVFTTKTYDRFGGLMLLFGLSALVPGLLVAVGVVPSVDQYYFNYFGGWYIVVGAFIFGFGAAIAGGCNLSMLYRAASGYVQNWLELFGMMVGTYIFATLVWPFQLSTMQAGLLSTKAGGYVEYLPYDLFHSVSGASVGATAVLLGVPFILFGVYLQRRTQARFRAMGSVEPVRAAGAGGVVVSRERESTGHGSAVKRAWRVLTLKEAMGTNLATVALFLDLLLVFIVGAGYTFNYLVITSSDGGRFLEYILMPFGVNLALTTSWYNSSLPIVDTSVLMVIMLIVGAFSASYLSGDFKIRIPRERRRLAIGFGGGILVGLGVRIALGCNVGLMWTNFAQLGYDGLLFLPSMLAGVALAVKVQEHLL